MKHIILSLLSLSAIACQATSSGPPSLPMVPPDAPIAPAPSDDPLRVEPAPTCEIGDTRPSDDGCNTCTCSEDGWACTARGCAPPNDHCSPGEKVSVPRGHDENTAVCDMVPPECKGDTHLGSDGMCYMCVPNPAPRGVASACVCNDDALWVCTELPVKA